MKVYRIIEYDGDETWINKQLDMSIHGTKELGNNKITAATISSEDHESIDIARNWLQDTQAILRKPGFN
jgi:hypothetical protein